MKKYIVSLITALVLVAMTTVSAFAYNIYEPRTKKFMSQNNYTANDIYELNAILKLSKENVVDRIITKYRVLKDWALVREDYNISDADYEAYMETQRKQNERFDAIPAYIYDEMEEAGWEFSQTIDFMNMTNLFHLDYEDTWSQIKGGRTLKEIVAEAEEKEKKESELMTQFIWKGLPYTQYQKSLADLLGTKPGDTLISDILTEALEIRKSIRDRHIRESGITEEEMKYCESMGITEILDMCQAKEIATGNNVAFDEVVQSKVSKGDWTSAIADVLNMSVEECRKIEEQSLAN